MKQGIHLETYIRQLDFKDYFKEFRLSVAGWSILSLSVSVLFSNLILKICNTAIINPIISTCIRNTYIGDIIFSSIFLSSVIFVLFKLYNKLLISINSVLVSFTSILLYLILFKFSNKYEYYHYKTFFLRTLTYGDVFASSILLMAMSFKAYLKPLYFGPSKMSLLNDEPSLENYADQYSRTAYAGTIAQHISQTTTRGSFAISVVGEWGSGKTDFLLRLEAALTKDQHNIISDFNPWRVSKPDAMIDDFFLNLSEKLSPYNHSISSKIKDYSRKILQPGKELHFRLIDTLISDCFEDESLQKRYNSINSAIAKTGKRLIVLIDDADRLMGTEVKEVMRIIRNTANFTNVFFIVSIDQKYIIDVLKSSKDFSNEDEYLKKIFQLIITLPSFKKEILTVQLKQMLFTDDRSLEENTLIENALAIISIDYSDLSVGFYPAMSHDNIFEKLIDNIRDLKRFCNSFKISFNILHGEVDCQDLMVLELIRNKNIELYNKIRNKTIFKFDINFPDQFVLHEKEWDQFSTENLALSPREISNLKDAVSYLLKDASYKTSRKFNVVHNFYLYFSYQLFDLISIREFNATLLLNTNAIIAKFNEWSLEKTKNELHRIIKNLDEFSDSEFLEKMIVTYLQVTNDHPAWMGYAWKLLSNSRLNNIKYFKNDSGIHRRFLTKLMANNFVSLHDRAELAKQFVSQYIYDSVDSSEAALSKKEWQKIIYRLFETYLTTNTKIDSNTLSFYYLNDDKRINGSTISLYPPASRLLKKALVKNPNLFEGYIRIIFRPYSASSLDSGVLVLEPFLPQIFGSIDNFKIALKDVTFENSEVNKAKDILLSVLTPFNTNTVAPFKLEKSEDELFVANWMKQNRINS